MTIKEILSEWGVSAIALISSLIGGIVRVVLSDKEVNFKQSLFQVLASIGFGGYGTEWLINYFEIETSNSNIGLIGFILGLLGVYLAKGIMLIGTEIEANPLTILTKIKKK